MYKVTFADKPNTFTGGHYTKSNWISIPDIPIEKLEYFIGKTKIVMSGYDAYNHLVEKKWVYSRGQYVTAIILFGKVNNIVTRIYFNLINRNQNIEEKMVTYHEYNKEYDEHSTVGWKVGGKIENIEPYYIIN